VAQVLVVMEPARGGDQQIKLHDERLDPIAKPLAPYLHHARV
jgi:hypothetical protein